MAGLCLLNVRELKLLEIFFFPRSEILPLHRCQPGKLAVDPGRIRVLHVPDVWHILQKSRTCEMRNRNCCYLTCCHSWESELFNRDHSNDPSPCNASQQDTLLLVTAHPSLRQLLSISTSSALQTPGPQSYLPTTHNRSCSKIRDFVCRFVAQLQYTLRGHFRLEVNRIAIRPPGLHIPYASPPLPHQHLFIILRSS